MIIFFIQNQKKNAFLFAKEMIILTPLVYQKRIVTVILLKENVLLHVIILTILLNTIMKMTIYARIVVFY